jgi:hypothetical protein
MINPPRPTKAKVEFEGDCFGSLFLKTAPECQSCLVARKCRKVTKRSVIAKGQEQEKGDEAVAKKNKKDKKDKQDKPEKKSKKQSGDFREGSFTWAMAQVLEGGLIKKGKTFDLDEMAKKTKMLCQQPELKIKFKPNRLPLMMPELVKQGYAKKVGKGEFKNVS